MHELDEKVERLARLCREAAVSGILLNTQANFSWITGGRSNRVDGSRELGAGALLVAADGRRFVLANAIEMPRLRREELVDVPCEIIEYPWVDDHAAPDTLVRLSRRVLGADAMIGADWSITGARVIDRDIARLRAPLTAAEVDRYRVLGRDVGTSLGALCRTLVPGIRETEVARRAADAVAGVGARAVVTLVAADDRIARYRHPAPTPTPWRRLLMVVMCAQREGLIVALSRLISAGPVEPDVASRTRATATVFARMLEATRTGASASDVFAAASRAYAEAGFAGEERLHHQGGATGYRSREWVAHPASEERVRPPQAFAWNPSITGTKVEETALAMDDAVEVLTTSPEWPSIPMDVHGRTLPAPDILNL